MLLLIIITGFILSVKAGNFNININDVSVQITSNETVVIPYCDIFPKEITTCLKKVSICIEESCSPTEDGGLSMTKSVINLKTIKVSSTIDVHNERLVNISDIVDPVKYISEKSTHLILIDGNITLQINLSVTCQIHYLSPSCDEIDFCKKLPSELCQNNGNCVQSDSQISCNCAQNFTGTFCQYRKDPCQKNFCNNNSTCLINPEVPLRYTCDCQSGFTGIFCSNDINECLDQTICSHLPNSTCYNTYGGFMCLCDKSCLIETTESPVVTTTIIPFKNQNPVFTWPMNSMHTLLLVVLEGAVIIMLIFVLIFVQIKHCPMKEKKTNYFLDDDFQFAKRSKPIKDRIILESNYVRQPIIPEDKRISLTPIFDSNEHDPSFNNDFSANTLGMSTFGRR